MRFETFAEKERIVLTPLEISLCAVLVAKACNIGFEPVVQSGITALEYDCLTWVDKNYFRKETPDLDKANQVEFHSKLPLHKMGAGKCFIS